MQEKQHLRLNNIKVDNIKSNWISDFHSINDMLKFFEKLSHIVNSLQLYIIVIVILLLSLSPTAKWS